MSRWAWLGLAVALGGAGLLAGLALDADVVGGVGLFLALLCLLAAKTATVPVDGGDDGGD
jgi:hypothetical protein